MLRDDATGELLGLSVLDENRVRYVYCEQCSPMVLLQVRALKARRRKGLMR